MLTQNGPQEHLWDQTEALFCEAVPDMALGLPNYHSLSVILTVFSTDNPISPEIHTPGKTRMVDHCK